MSLIHWWPLTGNCNDQGINSSNGVLINSGAFSNNGKFGKCLDFVSYSAGVDIPNNLVSELGLEYSASAWIYLLGTHQHYNGSIISSGDWNSSSWNFGILQDNQGIDPFGNGYCSTNSSHLCIPYSLELNKWIHIVSVMNNGIASVYVNGQFIGSTTGKQANLSSSADNMCIGRETYAGGYFGLNGRISDVRIYDHALSKQEIYQLYNTPVLHYDFNDPYLEDTENYESLGLTTSSYYTYEKIGNDHIFTKVDGTSSTLGFYANWFSNLMQVGDKVAISGYLYKNNQPYKTTYSNICTYPSGHVTETVLKSSGDDGYFSYVYKIEIVGIWICHAPLCGALTAGETITIKNLQIEKKDHSTPYTSYYRQNGFDLRNLLNHRQLTTGWSTYFTTTTDNEDKPPLASLEYYDKKLYKETNTRVLTPSASISSEVRFFYNYNNGCCDVPYLKGKRYKIVYWLKNVNGLSGLTVCAYCGAWPLPYGHDCALDTKNISTSTDWVQYVSTYVPTADKNGKNISFQFNGLITNTASADFSRQILKISCVGIYEDVSDFSQIKNISGFGYDGKIYNSQATIMEKNSPNGEYSMKFGNYQLPYISINNGSVLSKVITSGSITYWAKFDTSSRKLIIVGENGSKYIGAAEVNGRVYSDNVVNSVLYYKDGANPSNNQIQYPYDSSWHFYAVTNINISSWTNIYLNNYSSAWPLNGSISEVKIYPRILSSEEILNLYNTKGITDKNGNLFVSQIEETQENNNYLDYVSDCIRRNNLTDGIYSYTQAHGTNSIIESEIRTYKTPNHDGQAITGHGWDNWCGLFLKPEEKQPFLIKGHTYIIKWHCRGKSEQTPNVYWSCQPGWGDGECEAHPTVLGLLRHPANFDGEMDCYYKFKIEDDVYKTCTVSYNSNSFIAGNTYLSYKAFGLQYGYNYTGAVGTDIYNSNFRMYDITVSPEEDVEITDKSVLKTENLNTKKINKEFEISKSRCVSGNDFYEI